ncbi:MAG: amino acid ABC transporter permease [Kiloniellaceae bacterium]
MTDTTQAYEPGTHPDLPPPMATSGPIVWMKQNLFGSPLNIVLTLVTAYLLYMIVPGVLNWAIFDAVINAGSREECKAIGDGACWALPAVRFDQFLYGFYPDHLQWRINLLAVLFLLALVPVLWDNAPYRRQWFIYSLIFPVIMYFLLVGGLGLEPVETTKIGGFTLNVVIGVTGIVASLPLGILLALGRRSHMPIVRTLCVMFIEFIRGVPLITLLFVASTMLNYFLPPGTTFDLILRVLIMVTIFSSAYIAEVVRGGLQAIPKGQVEAADAMGLSYWQSMRLVVLPQALKISIPGIVNTFVGLFKDTTLVVIIGLTDVLGVGRAALSDAKWQGLPEEVYVFTAILFFVCCFSMARYSIYLEKKLHTGHKR